MSSKLTKVIANFESSIASKLTNGATSGALTNVTDKDGVALPAGKYCMILDRGTGNEEHLIFDLSGTTISNIKSVSRQGIQTSGVQSINGHRSGAKCYLTDFTNLKIIVDILNGDDTLDGSKPIKYDSVPTLTDPKELATVAYVLSVIGGGSISFDQQVVSGYAGETVTELDFLYFNEADQEWYKTAANNSLKSEGVKLGIAMGAGTNGNIVTNGILILGRKINFVGLTAGQKYYLSDTAGQISATPGTKSVFVGWAITTSAILFSPRETQIPTAAEKSKIAQGSPTGIISPFMGKLAPSGWLMCDGAQVSRSTYTDLFAVLCPSANFTVTIASPAVFTSSTHGLVAGDKIRLTTTGGLPSGLAINTDYYVIATGLTANAFQVSTTRGGSAVNTSGSQSGTHTWQVFNSGVGDGSTTFNIPNLKGKTVFGYDVADANFDTLDTPNTYIGEKTHQLTIPEIPAHTHTAQIGNGTPNQERLASQQNYNGEHTIGSVINSTGGDGAHNNIPPYKVANWIIKT